MGIALEKAELKDAALILDGQRRSFLPLLERYQDKDTNPCNVKLADIQNKIMNKYFYKILLKGTFVGAIFVHENPDKEHLKLHTLYILPEYQDKGIGGIAIDLVEKIHKDAVEWVLETPHDLKRNHHLYEKKGYRRTGKEEKINDNLTIVYFSKTVIKKTSMPKYLYHYYEASVGPFKSLTDLPLEEAEKILEDIRQEGITYASKRSKDYIVLRRGLEEKVRNLFVAKGGRPSRKTPHSMTLGECSWIKQWYKNPQEIKIPVSAFDPLKISFTYGDIFPAMRYDDGKPYFGKVYTLEEIEQVIQTHGLPQEWNSDGKYGPKRYIEVQVWDNIPIDWD
ncbi:MAG: GNAT family N-acetyltransferase [Bacillota bacterium]|nr:GNAT family N-acetyltransferase [Bacillota bacterium]